jgi:hypothetical protein
VNQACRSGAQPLCNVAVLAAAIWNPRIDGTAAASEGLHGVLLHHPPIIHVILVA